VSTGEELVHVFYKSILVAVVFGAAARAEQASPVTVQDAVAEASKNNPELRALTARIETARRSVATAKAYSYNPEFTYDEGLDRHFGVSQTIEWPGKRALRETIARQDVTVAEVALEGFKVALAAETRAAFYELLAAQKLVEVQERRVKATGTFLNTARRRVEGGFAPVTERAKAEADQVKARRELRAAEKAVVVASASLNALMGRDAQNPVQVQGELVSPPLTVPLEKIVAAALERNPELRMQRIELEKKGLNIKLARKEGAPDITVEPFYEQNTTDSSENKVGVGVTLPLPIWRRSGPFVAAAQAGQREAEATLEKTRREVTRNVQKAYAAFTSATDELALFKPDLLKELETQLSAIQEKYADGQVSFLVLLETQQTYFDYVKEYYETLTSVRTAQSELEKAAAVSLEDLK
jgi:outer membrane protein, heavy metal efflux system